MRFVRGCTLSLLVLISACATPSSAIKAGDLPDDEARTYLIFSDQLQRVRNVWKRPVQVCLAMPDRFIDFFTRSVTPTWPEVVERLRRDNATAGVKLEIESSVACLAKYVRVDNGPRPVLPQNGVLVLANGRDSAVGAGACGHKYAGGFHSRGLDRGVSYDVEVKDGTMHLTGGELCLLGFYRM